MRIVDRRSVSAVPMMQQAHGPGLPLRVAVSKCARREGLLACLLQDPDDPAARGVEERRAAAGAECWVQLCAGQGPYLFVPAAAVAFDLEAIAIPKNFGDDKMSTGMTPCIPLTEGAGRGLAAVSASDAGGCLELG
jgi:hypothetical protein